MSNHHQRLKPVKNCRNKRENIRATDGQVDNQTDRSIQEKNIHTKDNFYKKKKKKKVAL